MSPTIGSVEAGVVIESQEPDPDRRTVYFDAATGERWAVLGVCNRCGLCEIGCRDGRVVWNEGIPVGDPGACSDQTYDVRPDITMHPRAAAAQAKMKALQEAAQGRLLTGCSLTYEWIDGPF